MSNSATRLESRLREREDEYIRYEPFHILVGTFNVNNRSAPESVLLADWLEQKTNKKDPSSGVIPDIIAVGFQEIDTSTGAYMFDDRRKEDEWEQLVKKSIQACYETNQKEEVRFELLNRVRLMGILLFVYVRSVHKSKCSSISRSSVPTGFMGIAGNKGGVGIRFRFYETDLCFVNCHFASGDGQTQRRNDDYQTIESRMGFTDAPVYSIKDYFWTTPASVNSQMPNAQPSSGSTQWWKIGDHDIVFWCGDMNYRISQPNEQVRKAISELSTVPLHEKDQLRCEMKLDHVFCNYDEPPIEFMPTYKFDLHTDDYDTSEKLRTPSWTDRILYLAKRKKVMSNNEKELETIQSLRYSSATNIKFSDHRPVSGLYRVAIKYECDQKVSNRIREELIRESDRMENDAIPTIEVYPRPPEIVFKHIRYLDRPNYPLLIKNIGECPCVCTIVPTAISESFQSLTFTPSPPYSIAMKGEQRVNISFNSRQYRKQISEILILHVENGADTFITLDVHCDQGPFGLALDQFPPTLYDREKKEYVQWAKDKNPSEHIIEMKNDPPTLFIALIDCLKQRHDIDLLSIFSNDTQDSLDLMPLRDQIYENNYQFTDYSSAQLLMILIHLLQALPEPLISVKIQDEIFTTRQLNIARAEDMSKAVGTLIEQLTAKERNLFFRLLLLLQSCWPKLEQIEKNDDDDSGDIASVCIDVLAQSMLHEHVDRNQRRAFLLACLNEEKKN